MKWRVTCLLLLPLLAPSAYASSFTLGTAGSYGVLAGSAVTNTGPSVITGNLGVYAGSAVSGFPPRTVIGGTIHAGDAAVHTAQTDRTTAYNAAASLPSTVNLTGKDLGGMTLTPGVYRFDSSAQLTGTLTILQMHSSSFRSAARSRLQAAHLLSLRTV